ncbi:MAG: transcriptional regulator [Bacteroidetes bacterium]|nr:MAG: transcriptional regulator [Bacteroidota bacterium]
MNDRKIPIPLNCGLDLIAEVLYGKWKVRLLYFIHQGNKRPSQLKRAIPDASQRVLTMQLKELEGHELIEKTIYPQMPPKVEYTLTPLGKSIMPVLLALGEWADANQYQLRRAIEKSYLPMLGS